MDKSIKNNIQEELLFENKSVYITRIVIYKNQLIALSSNGQVFKISRDKELDLFDLNTENEKILRIKVIDNSLFLISEKAIYEYDFNTKQNHKIFSTGIGLDITDLIIKDNKLIFASNKGLLIQDRNIRATAPLPELIINKTLVNNKELNTEDLINLKNKENNLNIHFSVLCFIPNLKALVYYRINDGDWHKLEEENRNLMFNSLPSGKHKIELQAEIDGQLSEIETVNIEIEKPLWLKTWFIISTIVLILGILYLVINYKIQRERKKNKAILERVNLENSMNQSKLKAIKSQMNPHFFYNALNTIQSYILANEKRNAVDYLSKFSLLTRTILEMTEKDSVSIAEEIKTISLYLEMEKARFDGDFEYEIITDDTLDLELLRIPSMLLQIYVENALKHGLLHKKGEKKLKIEFRREADYMRISIDDNGIGRKNSAALNNAKRKKHQSFATEAMQERINLLNKNKINKITLTYIDKTNKAGISLGTQVLLKIPVE